MRTRTRIRRKVARRAPTVRRCGCNNRAQADAKQRMGETQDAGLMIGGAKDPAETRADTAARAVMSGGNAPVAHRKCASCANEDKDDKKAQREASGGGVASGKASAPAAPGVETAVSSMGEGRALSKGERSFFEPRFGRDFSDVRVHEDGAADHAARGMDASAFTVGSDIGIARGEYERSGPALMAHELAHVADENDRTARRTVRGNSVCPTTVPGAPADPIAAITADDSMARSLAIGASALLQLTATDLHSPFFRVSDVYTTFEQWFGLPQRESDATYNGRLGGGNFTSQDAAVASEMTALGDRYMTIGRWFNRSIRYRCPNLGTFTLPGCTANERCSSSDTARACSSGARHIVLCNDYWGFSDTKARATLLIHEAFHAALRIEGHPTSLQRRMNNPACNGGFLRQVFSTQGATTPQCPPP